MQERAAEVGRQVARRSARETRKAVRRFGTLVLDTTKTVLGVGQRRVNRRNNRTTAGRYINDLITVAETTHLAGRYLDLSKVLVEPRFLGLPPVEEPIQENEAVQEVFYVIPRMPDMPEIIEPYNLPSFRIHELAVGSRRLVICGTPGSGRTTALMAILLWSIRELQFEESDDPVKKLIEKELESLSDKEREKLEREREERLAAAREEVENLLKSGELKKPKAITQEEAYRRSLEAETDEEPLPAFNELLPIFVHAADLRVDATVYGAEIDPAEPLVRALQRQVNTLTARTIPRLIYDRLESNRTLVLIDGYEALPKAEQTRVKAWLRAFTTQYGRNFIIMTGPAKGYGELAELDMTPIFMKPWNRDEKLTYLQKWSNHWENMAERGLETTPITNQQVKRANLDTYGLTPAEMTVKIWAAYSQDSSQPGAGAWVDTYLRSQVSGDWEALLPLISAAARLQTDLGFVTRQGIEVLFQEQESQQGGVSETALRQIDTEQADGYAPADADEDDLEAEDEAAIERARQLRSLMFDGVLRAHSGGRYRFRHRILSDYLASLSLKDAPTTELVALAQNPRWQRPLMFAVQHTDLTAPAMAKLSQHPDVLRSHQTELARWLAYLPQTEGVEWRDELLTQLGNAFVQPDQFIALRERIAAALVASRDPGGALRVFAYGLQSKNPEIRQLSCLGIGAMGHHGRNQIELLEDALLDPRETLEVQIAAAHALAALREKSGYYAMEQAMQEGEALVSQAVAEAFAQVPEHGYEFLYRRVKDEQMHTRRSALFGLARIETQWARDLVYETFLDEDEWYVRVVAQEAFLMEDTGPFGPEPVPAAADVDWIVDWAAQQQIQMPQDKASNQVFSQLLNDAEMRVLAAVATGQIGAVEAIRTLYSQLDDPELIVREVAYKALVDLQLRMGEPLPDPN